MTRIPVHRNAKLLQPEDSERWPVMVFSHGLGGSRNAYSHICGLIASHGICVIAPDHRDTSAPVSFVRATANTPAKTVPYQKYSHTPSVEIYQARDGQLRIRLWELGLIHDTIVKIDKAECPQNLDHNHAEKSTPTEILPMFKDMLDVHRPGSIIWAGHSFGATTMVQLMKSTYYSSLPEPKGEFDEMLFLPDRSSHLTKQITSSSVALLLDMWCLPLRSQSTRWLWDKPMPCYDVSSNAPAGGKAILAVLSEAFFKWEGNLNDTKRILSPTDPSPSNFTRWTPYCFYPSSSAHLSQSDFGILFPLITSRVLKTKEPERILKLNARAMLQVLRNNGFNVAPPTPQDLDQPGAQTPAIADAAAATIGGVSPDSSLQEKPRQRRQDHDILSSVPGRVREWNAIPVEGFGAELISVDQDYKTPNMELDEAQVLDFYSAGNNSESSSSSTSLQEMLA
jgi:platelet-activating factor acetylhydrolase